VPLDHLVVPGRSGVLEAQSHGFSPCRSLVPLG
jgi:hypothetical protein